MSLLFNMCSRFVIYNEKENIEAIIRAVMGLPLEFHVLIIDDGSPDGTADIVKGLQKKEFKDKLFLIERAGKQNLDVLLIQVDFVIQLHIKRTS